MIVNKKLTAVKNRIHMNIKSGNVMIRVEDRNWMIQTIENMSKEIQYLEKKLSEMSGNK